MFRFATFRNSNYAAQAAVDALSGEVAGKASAADLASGLAAKADAASVAALDQMVQLKADTSYVDAAVAGKVDSTQLADGLATKADASALSALEGVVAGKADSADLAAKADASALSALEGVVAGKASSQDLIDGLSAKADQAYVDTALSTKVEQAALTEALALKADEASLQALAGEVAGKASSADLAAKADQSAVDAALAGKADAGAFATAEATVAALDEAMNILVGDQGALNVETAPGSGVPFIYNGTLGGQPAIIEPSGTFAIGSVTGPDENGGYTAQFGWAFQNATGGILTGTIYGTLVLGPISIDAAGMANASITYPYIQGAEYKILASNEQTSKYFTATVVA